MSAPPDTYVARRTVLASRLRRPLVLFAGHAQARNYVANTFPFRAASSYLYFGGPVIENAALLIEPGSDGIQGCHLFRPPHDLDDVVWLGPLPTDADIAQAAGLPAAHVREIGSLGTALGGRPAAGVVPHAPRTLALSAQLALHAPDPDELNAIITQRLIKDEHELTAMRWAADVTVEAHRAAMAVTRPGVREADVASEFLAVLTANQCHPSFNPIITVRGEVLHCHGYPNLLQDGQLLLVDGGAEEPGGYASDMTRTFPVNGVWSGMQRELYDVVLRANEASVAACVSGARYLDVHNVAAREICAGLVQLGLLRGQTDDLLARNAHALFFVHGVGHLIGLDVHDMEDFGDLAGYAPGRSRPTQFGAKFLRMDRDLLPGMCVTIEPGIYIGAALAADSPLAASLQDALNREEIDLLLRDGFGGIRIEQTICVSADGPPEVLTAGLPTDADEMLEGIGLA